MVSASCAEALSLWSQLYIKFPGTFYTHLVILTHLSNVVASLFALFLINKVNNALMIEKKKQISMILICDLDICAYFGFGDLLFSIACSDALFLGCSGSTKFHIQ